MAAVKEHCDAIIVNAHDTDVIILFLTTILRFPGICAGCNLHQHDAFCLHDLVSDLRLCMRTHVRATSWQSAVRNISKRAVLPARACVMAASANHWEGFLESMYRVLLGGGAACSELQQEIFEQRLVIHLLLGRSYSCDLQDSRCVLRLRPCTARQRRPIMHGCRGLCRLALH